MKKLIYLAMSVFCAVETIYGIYATVTGHNALLASIVTDLLFAFLAWLFMHLFLKPEPRHKHQAENAPEPSQEAPSDARRPTRSWETSRKPITTITWPSTSRPRD